MASSARGERGLAGLVATVQGLVALSPSDSAAPALVRDAAFAAPDLRGPIALGE